MSPVLLQLVVGAAFLLAAAALGVSAITHEQAERRRFRERIALVAAPYVRVNALVVMGRSAASRSAPVARAIAAVARLFAYNPARAAQYPLLRASRIYPARRPGVNSPYGEDRRDGSGVSGLGVGCGGIREPEHLMTSMMTRRVCAPAWAAPVPPPTVRGTSGSSPLWPQLTTSMGRL